MEVMSTLEDYSHLVCVCKTCPDSNHLLGTNNEPEVNADHEMPVVVFFDLCQAKKLEIRVGSTVHIAPPWLVHYEICNINSVFARFHLRPSSFVTCLINIHPLYNGPCGLLPPANEVWARVTSERFYTCLSFCSRRWGGGQLPSMHHKSHDLHPRGLSASIGGGGSLRTWGGQTPCQN